MNKIPQQHHGARKLFIVIIILALITGSVLCILWHDKKIFTARVSSNSSVGTKSSSSKSTTHVPTSNNSTSSGGVLNQNGQTTGTTPPSSEWVSSSNGALTLQQPIANSTIQSGDTISGVANVSNVQFILTDSAVGLIDQGNLSVVNGKFSGTLQFTPYSGIGTLQVYYPNPNNGAEEDIVNISVNFNF